MQTANFVLQWACFTAPPDPQALAASACNASAYLGSGVSSVCLNGGSCAFDLFAGKLCSCLPGYYGQFCQYQGDASGNIETAVYLHDFIMLFT